MIDDATGRRAEVAARIDAVRGLLDARGAGAALLSARRNFAWLTAGGNSHIVLSTERGVAGLLVERTRVTAITQNIEADRLASEELAGVDIETVPVPWWEPGAIEAMAERMAGAPPLADAALEDALGPVRSVLSPFDQRRTTRIGEAVSVAIAGALAELRPGATEEALAADLAARLPGCRVPVVLVAADDRIVRFRHPIPTATRITGRVMAVLVAERWGLHVAVTRFRELEPPTAELADRIAATSRVELAMHEATRPGATLGMVIAAAQAAYRSAGFPDEWRDHHQGGTIAYQGRERVAIPDDATAIVPGMAFAWNPSIAGAKAEDTFILGSDGVRSVVTT